MMCSFHILWSLRTYQYLDEVTGIHQVEGLPGTVWEEFYPAGRQPLSHRKNN